MNFNTYDTYYTNNARAKEAMDNYRNARREFLSVGKAYGAKLASYRDYVEAYKAFDAAHQAFDVAYTYEQLTNCAHNFNA